jgi:hypothetical protein
VRACSSVAGLACALALALVACAKPPIAPAPSAHTAGAPSTAGAAARRAAARDAGRLQRIGYEFTLPPALDGLRARVCFRGRPPPALVSGLSSADIVLRDAWVEDARARRRLSIAGGRVSLAGVPSGACIGYAMAFDAAAAGLGRPAVERRGDAIAVNVAGWLLRPSIALEPEVVVDARFSLPAGMRASVPWPLAGDRYRVERSAFVFYAFAAFGRFEVEQIEIGDSRVEVAVLDGLPPETRAAVVPWLRSAARMASLALGRFPRARAQVVVLPAPAAAEPVRYGMMNRGGGSSALMLLSANATRGALERDWVALHEFCHLLHPFVQRQDAWLSEGLATYFAEVLRARAGAEPEQLAWQRLYDGARLGTGVARGLGAESADMFQNASFKRVYWGGAAFALLADVAVRRYTQGRRSLPSVLGDVLGSWVHEPRAFSALEIAALIDRALGAPLMRELMQRWVTGDALPSLDGVYAELGLEVVGDRVRASGSGGEAWIRDAIMRGAQAPAAAGAAAARAP